VGRIFTTVLVFALVLPAGAEARTATLAPPGNSAVSQYLETVPTDRGPGVPPASQGPSRGQPPAQPGGLSAAERRQLAQAGSDGRALAALVDGTSSAGPGGSPQPAHPARGGGPGASVPASRRSLAGADTRSPVASLLSAALGRDAGGGIGLLLPTLMLVGLAAVAVRFLRRGGAAE
jgi:hypothetical protein